MFFNNNKCFLQHRVYGIVFFTYRCITFILHTGKLSEKNTVLLYRCVTLKYLF